MRDLSNNKNIKHLETFTVPSLENHTEIKMDFYRCRTRSGLWKVTTSTEYSDRYKCWFERLVMSHWNDRNVSTLYLPTVNT